MSGGVDSSVAALLLLEANYRVEGVTLRLYDSCGGKKKKSCCGLEDVLDARAAAASLTIKHTVLEHQAAFKKLVIKPFIKEYASGRTPNPCIRCNEAIKFGTLLEYAVAHNFDAVATGHHARMVRGKDGECALLRGRDAKKDQSYVLFPLTREQRWATLLPVGEWTKSVIRAKARSAGLPTAEKKESQDICFVGDRGYADFVKENSVETKPGLIRHTDGRILGNHDGIHRYTLGQRRGLGISAPAPLYVTAIDPVSGEVTVGAREALSCKRFVVDSWLWHDPPESRPREMSVQVRYHQPPGRAKVVSEFGRRLVLEWLDKGRCVTPGQAAVGYDGSTVAGGGWISGRMT